MKMFQKIRYNLFNRSNSTVNSTYVHYIQCEIIHYRVTTNSKLHIMNTLNDPKCTFCYNNVKIMVHASIECPFYKIYKETIGNVAPMGV